jgi:hypothetical protein
MSKSDILERLPTLGQAERREILERISEMEEAVLLKGAPPGADEKAMLDREFEEFEASPKAGAEWKEVEARLRQQNRH